MDIRNKTAVVVLALFGSSLAGCSGSSGDGGLPGGVDPRQGLISTPPEALELEDPQSCSAFDEFVTKAITGLILNGGFVGCRDCILTLTGGAAAQPALGTDQQSFERFTETNNQEAGVDELDQIETDAAGYFYVLDGTQLVVANGLPPANLRRVAKLDLGGYADGLLLDPVSRRLVIARSEYFAIPFGVGPTFAPTPMNPVTELMFVNVADPAAPVMERRLRVEGFNLAVRRVGSRVHVVTHATPFMPLPIVNDEALAALRERLASLADAPRDSVPVRRVAYEIRNRVATLVAATDPLDYLPNLTASADGQTFTDVTPADCSNVAYPNVALRLGLTAVTSVDSDGTDVASLVVANDSWNVYASEQHVYLSQTSGGWWFDPAQRQQTAIYKIEIGAGRPVYRAFGAVEGWANSSFQFSEHDGYLRVATNRSELDPVAGRLQDNHLYVLGDNGARRLNVVGKVNGFGAGERIFSTRFLGTRGFVVTFRQIDPLFTLDLHDPYHPTVVGERLDTGFSRYLQPLSSDRLLGTVLRNVTAAA